MSEVGESRAIDDFVKAVYTLQQESERVSTNALRDALGITAPSVTDMARRLEELKLIDYRKYYGVRLTARGETMALKIIRRHRLIELYLVQELSYKLHEVHDEAEQLEHVVSDRFVEAVALKLGNPEFDPHGEPIPSADGVLVQRELCPLSELPVSTPARVSRYTSHDADILQHTLDKGFTLDTEVEVLTRDPFNGPLTVRTGSSQTIIGHGVAETILVEVVE